jgi:DNA-directed RNA polymerase subunit RPC12/RpoP
MAETKETRRPEEIRCATCGIRRMAEANPDKIMARVWKWHTGWCPGWNAYQKALAEAGEGMAPIAAKM